MSNIINFLTNKLTAKIFIDALNNIFKKNLFDFFIFVCFQRMNTTETFNLNIVIENLERALIENADVDLLNYIRAFEELSR